MVVEFHRKCYNAIMYQRHIQPLILDALEDTPVIVISGARQTGKSTLCEQLIESNAFDAAYITFDNPAILRIAREDPLGFLRSQKKHVVLDEIQRAPELLISIKQLVDEDRKNRRYILTGSAEVMTLPKVSDSLAGRIEIHNLWPLSQDEIKGCKSNLLQLLVGDGTRLEGQKTDWNEIVQMLAVGGYPEVMERKRQQRREKWYKSYLDSILQKDIQDLANIEGLLEIPNLLGLFASRVGGLLNLAEVSRIAQIPQSTLKRYYSLLQQIFLIVEIPAWTPNLEGRFVKSPKVYLNDTGLLCHLQNVEAAHLLRDKNLAGRVLENFVVLELVKQLSWSDTSMQPYHFRTHRGREVDLVLENRRREIFGIEVKATDTPSPGDFKGLKALQALKPTQFKKGIVLYTGEHFLGGFGENLYAVPLSALWEG